MALSSLLYNELRQTLMGTGPFDSNEELRAVFSDPRLTHLRHSVPEATNRDSRVNLTIAKLLDDWTTNGDNALYLFLTVLSEQTGKPDFADLAERVRIGTIQDRIAACQRELKLIAEHLEHGWSGDPASATSRQAKVEEDLRQWEERLQATPAPISVSPGGSSPGVSKPASGTSETEANVGADETYTDLEIHIAPRDVNAGLYAVTAEVDGGGEYSGTLQMGTGEREALLAMTDPAEYGFALFEALFHGNILTAYIGARAKAAEGRLRLRLRIAREVADLHALVWERLHYPVEGGAFPMATDAKLLFSRYIGLQRGAASAIAGPVRMLCVLANPQDLEEKGFARLDVQVEIANLRAALDGLRQAGVDITIMPGRTELSNELTQALVSAGYTIRSGSATLDNVFEALAYAPGYHLLHFVGHGTFSQRTKRAALVFENNDGQMRLVTDSDLTRRLNGLDHKPHLIFLAACESASRPADEVNPFVGLAPRLVQIGIPAVIAMQDKIGVGAAQTLTRHFYRFLLQHGIVDKALNQARGFLADGEWDVPALFMRLREGRLLEQSALPPVTDPPQLPNSPVVHRDTVPVVKPTALSPNPFTDMLMIRDAARFIGREDELRRVRSLLQGGSVTLVGEPKIGKSSLMARLAGLWRAENGARVFGPLDCQGVVLGCEDFFNELAKLIGLPITDDRRVLRDALRITSGLLLLDEMDCAPGWGLTADDFALFRAVCSANPAFKLVVASRVPLKMLFPDSRRGSPSYNFLIPHTLGPLNDADARALLAHPWDTAASTFDATTVDVLLALAGTHPFKLQRAAHHRYEALRDPGYDWQTAYRDEIAQML